MIDLDQSQVAEKEEDLWFCKNPKWYDIYFDKEEKAGSLLLGFTVVRNQSQNDLFQKLEKMNLQNKSHSI